MNKGKDELKKIKKISGLHWSEIADEMGISEATLYIKLRHLTEDFYNEVLSAIKALQCAELDEKEVMADYFSHMSSAQRKAMLVVAESLIIGNTTCEKLFETLGGTT